jgi:hypothetical protein
MEGVTYSKQPVLRLLYLFGIKDRSPPPVFVKEKVLAVWFPLAKI